jgi:hypothetical protein
MNELMAPFYYLAATSATLGACGDACADQSADRECADDSVSAAEAAAFACFVPLLGELRDLFCAACDGSAGGVAGTLAALARLISAADPELGAHLEKLGVNPQFYAFRWITTALTQEFPLPDALRAWDALLADEGGARDALTRVAAAMVLHLRAPLLAGDFATNLKLLQAFPPADGALTQAECQHEMRARARALTLRALCGRSRRNSARRGRAAARGRVRRGARRRRGGARVGRRRRAQRRRWRHSCCGAQASGQLGGAPRAGGGGVGARDGRAVRPGELREGPT